VEGGKLYEMRGGGGGGEGIELTRTPLFTNKTFVYCCLLKLPCCVLLTYNIMSVELYC